MHFPLFSIAFYKIIVVFFPSFLVSNIRHTLNLVGTTLFQWYYGHYKAICQVLL